MGERHSEFDRDENDWYVESQDVVHRLLDRVSLPPDGLHDPCCGLGTIVRTAQLRGKAATGADLVDRAGGAFPVRDFLTDHQRYPSIVTNPPFKIAADIVRLAMTLVDPGGLVAVVAQAKFLFSQSRNPMFGSATMERVIVFSRRPSMPPGKMLVEQGEACRGGGSIDFCWCVWRVGKTQPGAEIEWTM